MTQKQKLISDSAAFGIAILNDSLSTEGQSGLKLVKESFENLVSAIGHYQRAPEKQAALFVGSIQHFASLIKVTVKVDEATRSVWLTSKDPKGAEAVLEFTVKDSEKKAA